MNQTEFDSLIMLLDDPDPSVAAAVQQRLRNGGADIIPNLEKVWQTSTDNATVKMLEHLIHDIRIDGIASNLAKWSRTGADNLLAGVAVYNRLLFPNVTIDTIKAKIDSICKPIWTEFNSSLTALEKVRIINHFLFNQNKYTYSDDFSTQSHFLSTLLNTGRAHINILAVLYAIVAQHLQLPVYCVELPSALTLCYVDELNSGFDNNVLFYIDVRTRGTAYGSSEITDYLRSTNTDDDEKYYKPCGNLNTVRYLLYSLAQCFRRLKDPRMADCERIIDSLTIK
ncbi:MAG: hypothetical protein IKW77_04135 [Salinivirgaceae bacterium]|nr:hypothetical protein [Salinivirgaceae bacterium]